MNNNVGVSNPTGVTNNNSDVANLTGLTNVSQKDSAIDAITDIRKNHSRRDRIKADLVRRFQHALSFPSDSTIIHSANTNGVKNSPITQREAKLSAEMLGLNKHSFKDKIARL